MAQIEITGINVECSKVSTALKSMLMCEDIVPGCDASYELCKQIYLYHPLGRKMAEKPISIAMSQKRNISIPNSPELAIKEAFEKEWDALGIDQHIFNVMRLSRMYGISTVAYDIPNVPSNVTIDPSELYKFDLYFNVFDPLNTAGSLVLNQDTTSPLFQKYNNVEVSGKSYSRSRACVVMHEDPIYISYTTSAFGFVGRSVYQRALYPLKTFIQSMITDDMVTRKAGVIVAKTKPPGSITTRTMLSAMGIKRNYIKEAETNNVISISLEEDMAAIDLRNTDTAMTVARKNVLENIASAADMPAHMINQETFAEGFGEGTEDAKSNAEYINGVRGTMRPLYIFFDKLVQHRAWNPAFYENIQKTYPEYANVPYNKAFYDWSNSFTAIWPSLLIEPDSELCKIDEIKLNAAIAAAQILLPNVDPLNKARVVEWLALTFNENKILFKHPLELDIDDLRNYVPPVQEGFPQFGDDTVDNVLKFQK